MGRVKMNKKEIRRNILEILYEIEEKHPGNYFPGGKLEQKLGLNKNQTTFHINYLEDEGYILTTRGMRGYYAAKISNKGINLVENDEEFTKLFPPVSITQYNIKNSSGFSAGDFNIVNINIQDSFNQIYEQIDHENPSNKEEIKAVIHDLEKELQKEFINKSKINKNYNWLKRNANWTIPTITQIIIAAVFGSV